MPVTESGCLVKIRTGEVGKVAAELREKAQAETPPPFPAIWDNEAEGDLCESGGTAFRTP